MRLVAAFVAGVPADVGRQGAWAATNQWPPPGETIHPLSARPVPARSVGSSASALQVVVELELTQGREATFQGVRIGYHVGSDRYRQVWPLAVRACAPGVPCQAPPPPSS
jgi:hypothetical protein